MNECLNVFSSNIQLSKTEVVRTVYHKIKEKPTWQTQSCKFECCRLVGACLYFTCMNSAEPRPDYKPFKRMKGDMLERVHTMDSITAVCMGAYIHTRVHAFLYVFVLIYSVYLINAFICLCVQVKSALLYLCKGLYSSSSRATPVAVARTERIQKLS